MKTQDELKQMQRDNAKYVATLAHQLTKAKMGKKDPRLLRSTEIAILRLYHMYVLVSRSFNKICKRNNRHMYLRPIKGSYRQVVKHKYTATCLSIMQLISEEGIDLDRWMLAQYETLTIPVFTPYQCFGYNALSRYNRWESKQQVKYQKEDERKAQTESRDKTLTRSVLDSHVTALKWAEVLKQVDPPNQGAALWYLWPSVSVWYLLAHKSFSDDVMAPGFCTNPTLLKYWKSYVRSPHVQQVCELALREAETTHGVLNWKA
jgi:hypothetical protein